MLERFTERARQVVMYAQEEARELHHAYIGTEHVLLGILREDESLGARVLASLDVTTERVRAEVVRCCAIGGEMPTGQIPFTPRAKKVLELALREALGLGHNYIGTEHVLLGIVRENAGVAARILLDFDADAERVRNEVIRALSGPRSLKTETLTFWVWHNRGPAVSVEAVNAHEAARAYATTNPGNSVIYVAASVEQFSVSLTVEAA